MYQILSSTVRHTRFKIYIWRLKGLADQRECNLLKLKNLTQPLIRCLCRLAAEHRAAKLWAGAAQARIPFDRVETWKKESRSRWLQDWWASPAVFQHLLFTSRWAKHSLTRHNMWIPLHCFCCCHSAGKPQWATPRRRRAGKPHSPPPPFRQPGS